MSIIAGYVICCFWVLWKKILKWHFNVLVIWVTKICITLINNKKKIITQDQWTKWFSYVPVDLSQKTIQWISRSLLSVCLSATYGTLPSLSYLHCKVFLFLNPIGCSNRVENNSNDVCLEKSWLSICIFDESFAVATVHVSKMVNCFY